MEPFSLQANIRSRTLSVKYQFLDSQSYAICWIPGAKRNANIIINNSFGKEDGIFGTEKGCYFALQLNSISFFKSKYPVVHTVTSITTPIWKCYFTLLLIQLLLLIM